MRLVWWVAYILISDSVLRPTLKIVASKSRKIIHKYFIMSTSFFNFLFRVHLPTLESASRILSL